VRWLALAIEVKGIGNATVWATDALDVRISGGGSVDSYGHPRVTQKVTGRGKGTWPSVRCRNRSSG
jgi:hypothetical protein